MRTYWFPTFFQLSNCIIKTIQDVSTDITYYHLFEMDLKNYCVNNPTNRINKTCFSNLTIYIDDVTSIKTPL